MRIPLPAALAVLAVIVVALFIGPDARVAVLVALLVGAALLLIYGLVRFVVWSAKERNDQAD